MIPSFIFQCPPVRSLLRAGCLLAVSGFCLGQLPAQADPALDKAHDFLKAGRVEAAVSIYTEILRHSPDDLQSRLALAEIAMRRFEYGQAREILEKTLARHPESAETAATLGRLFQRWSNSPGGKAADNTRDYRALAQEHFRHALAMNPDSPLVLAYAADWQLQQEDLIRAEQSLQKALTINPIFLPALHGQIRFHMKTRDMARAKDAALHAIELDPGDSESYFLVAQLLALANHPAEAVRYAEKSEQLDFGRLPERDYFLARQYETLGDTEKAIRYYEALRAYTPQDANVWLKLGDLYDSVNRPADSLNALRRAVSLQPGLAEEMRARAREQTRNENIDGALAVWRKVLALNAEQPGAMAEALGGMASLHYLHAFYHPEKPHPALQRDLKRFEDIPQGDYRLQLDKLKMRLAQPSGLTPALRQELSMLTGAPDPAVGGEAAFILGQYAQAHERWEAVDGLSPEEYTRLADRLLLDQELVFSRVFYQRAYELAPDPALETAGKRIQAKQALAAQRVDEGNTLFGTGDYTGAIEKYREANRIYRQWDNAYLRLGDTHEKLKQWKEAKAAYDAAIALSPSLMGSKGFAKHYAKVKKKAAP